MGHRGGGKAVWIQRRGGQSYLAKWVTAHIPVGLHMAVSIYAAERGMTMAETIDQALTQFIQRQGSTESKRALAGKG